ncbi:hypothetical protein [Pelobacter propionicus]|nr:hypothetical protein [Pelobacter propionicus]
MAADFGIKGRTEEARQKYCDLIFEAYKSGLSIMEIARVTGSTKADYFYTVLRREGIFPPMSRGRSRKNNLPEQVADVFITKQFSFYMWCHVWGFDPVVVTDALQASAPPPGDEMADQIHRAFRRDFPDQYEKIFPISAITNQPIIRLKTGLLQPETKQVVSIAWSNTGQHFVASIYGEDDVEGIGRTRGEALKDMERVWWIHKGIIRLSDAIDRIMSDT